MLKRLSIRWFKACVACLAALMAGFPLSVSASPELYSQMLRGAQTLEQYDEALKAIERGRQNYGDKIHALRRVLENENIYLLRNGAGDLITPTRTQMEDLGVDIALEITLDPTERQLKALLASANKGSQVDLALRAAILQALFGLSRAEGRAPDPVELGNATTDAFLENVREFDAENRLEMYDEEQQLVTDRQQLNELIARAKRDRAEFARSGRSANGGGASASGQKSTPRDARYLGEVDPEALINKSSARFETPIHFSISGGNDASILFDFWVYSRYQERGASRQACMMGVGRVDEIAVGADRRFNATLPLALWYRTDSAASEHPCMTLRGKRESGDQGDRLNVAVTGDVDGSSGVVNLTLQWIHGPFSVTLRQQ